MSERFLAQSHFYLSPKGSSKKDPQYQNQERLNFQEEGRVFGRRIDDLKMLYRIEERIFGRALGKGKLSFFLLFVVVFIHGVLFSAQCGIVCH